MNNKKLRNYNLIGISGHKESGKDLVARIIQYLRYREENPNFSTDSISSINLSNYFQYGFCLFPTNGEECINIIEESGLENRKFADKVKDIVCLLIGCTREQLEDRDFKEKPLGEEWWIYRVKDTPHSPYRSVPYNKDHTFKSFYSMKEIQTSPRILLQLLGTDFGREMVHPNIWINSLLNNYIPNVSKWLVSDVRFSNEVEAIQQKGGVVVRIVRDENTSDKHTSEVVLNNYGNFDFVVKNDGTIADLIQKIKEIY